MLHSPILSAHRQLHASQFLPARRRMAGMLRSNRVALGLALLFAILVPEFVHGFVSNWGRWFVEGPQRIEFSSLASMIALIGAHISLRQLGVLPLVSAKLLIFPAFIGTYSIVITATNVAHLPIEPFHFWTSFFIGIAWYWGLAIFIARNARPEIGVIGEAIGSLERLPVNVMWHEIRRPVLDHHVDAIVIDPHAPLELEWSSFITSLVLGGIPVYHRAHIEEGLTGRTRFTTSADNNFGALLPSLAYLRIKRALDVFVLIPAAILAFPVLVVAGIAIKLDSPGPVFFNQVRVGYRGKLFVCHKLRTMHCGQAGPAYTAENDARITRTGKILRKWRIDELPQLLNVLKGDMSWIGPRPEARELATAYAEIVPFYEYRHAVRPGISGWAAVHQGNVALAEAAQIKLEYDFYYIKYFSMWLDSLIFLKTLQTVWNGYGSR